MLLRPRVEISRLAEDARELTDALVGAWSVLIAIAVLGSCLYGASLALVISGFRFGASAAWLTLSSGIAWLILGPALIAISRLSPVVVAHACLVTIAYGEGVLVIGAGINALLAAAHVGGDWVVPFNFAWVGLSNGVMATALALQLRAVGVRTWKTLACWVVFLNGSGALLFWVFYRVLLG